MTAAIFIRGDLIRARRWRRLPVVLTREEAKSLLSKLAGTERLFLTFLYGTGLLLEPADKVKSHKAFRAATRPLAS